MKGIISYMESKSEDFSERLAEMIGFLLHDKKGKTYLACIYKYQ